MPKIKGKVTAVSNKDGRYGLRMNAPEYTEIWFNDFGDSPVEKGELIELEFTVNTKNGKTYHNIGEITKFESNVPEQSKINKDFPTADKLPSYEMARDAKIIRQVAFKGAIEVFNTVTVLKANCEMTFDGCKTIVEQLTNDFEKIILNMGGDNV
jgi:hypothetical protein